MLYKNNAKKELDRITKTEGINYEELSTVS